MSNRALTSFVDRLRSLLAGPGVAVRPDGELLDRFARHGDQEAFAALVQRFGPMVLGVCRRVLGDPHRADDAFQATFLVLAKKASSLGDRPLSGWLSTVAYHAALRVRAGDARRLRLERSVMGQQPRVVDDILWDDVSPLLDEELQRLPEKYRLPIVLCHLRGATHEQAAAELACPVGTIRSRLARGRDLLRSRLSRRGLALSVSALTALLGANALAVEPSTGLIQITLQAVGSGEIGPIAQEVLRTMLLMNLKWAFVLASSVVLLGSIWMLRDQSRTTPIPPPASSGEATKEGTLSGTEIGAIRLPLFDVPTASKMFVGDRAVQPRAMVAHLPRVTGAVAAKAVVEGTIELLPPKAGAATAVILSSILRNGSGEASNPALLSRRDKVFTLVVDDWNSNYEYRRNVAEEQAGIVMLGNLAAGDYELRLVVRQMNRKEPEGQTYFHCEGQKSATVKFTVAAADADAGKVVPRIGAGDLKAIEFAAEERERAWQRPEARAEGPWIDDQGAAKALGLRVGTFDPEAWRKSWPPAVGVPPLSKMLPEMPATKATSPVYALVVGPVMPELHMLTSLRDIEWRENTAIIHLDAWSDGGPNDHNVPVCPVLVVPLTLPTVKDQLKNARPGKYTVKVEWTLLYAERWNVPHKVTDGNLKWVKDFFTDVRARSEDHFTIE